MTQKSAKKKSKKNAKSGANDSVLGNLRSTRPIRLGGDRRAASRSRATAATKPDATKSSGAQAATEASAKKSSGAKGATKAKAKRSPTAATRPKATAARRPAPPPPPPPRSANGRPRGTEIVTTAVQAAGELAQIGATVGSQLLKRAARRIPRP